MRIQKNLEFDATYWARRDIAGLLIDSDSFTSAGEDEWTSSI